MKTTLYIDRESIVHRLHPTLKIFGLFIAFWSIYWIDNPLTLLPFIAVELAVAAFIHAGENIHRFRWFFVLIVLPTMITWLISYRRGTPIINMPLLHVSKESILFGLGKGMKVAALVLGSVLFLSSTKVEELSVGLSKLGLPYRIGFTITLAFRLVPLFIESALTVVDAQRLRGYDFDAGGPFERIGKYVPVIIPVFMGALRKANNMAMALEARGFGRSNLPTSFIEYRMHRRDAGAFTVLIAVGAISFMLYWTGYGAIPGASIHS
jgi:energy-coupling factor transport system permease protein